MSVMQWHSNLPNAMDTARVEGKPILLDCYNPH